MAKISEDCLKEAYEALRKFSKEELADYVRDVFIRAKEIDPLQGARSLDAASKEINDQMLKEFFSDATQKAKNILAFEANAKPIKEGKADFRGVLAGRQLRNKYFRSTEKDSAWRKRNIPDAVKAEYEKVMQLIVGDLTHEELEHFTSGNFDEEICDIIDGKKSNNPMSNKIAEKIKQYWDYNKTQLILSGAMKPNEFHPKRFFGGNHDQQKVLNGSKSLIKEANAKGKVNIRENKPMWRNFIKQFLDMEWTFKRTDAAELDGTINEEEADKIIDRIYDNITTGKSTIFTRSTVANDREAVARKSKMFFVWKNLRAQYEYNKNYGRGNLFGMLMGDAQSSSHKIGTAKMWGDNPYTMYNDLKAVQESIDPKGALWWNNTDNYFKSVMKLDRLNGSPNVANFFSNLRTATSMARLPTIALTSIPDIGFIASFANRIGVSYFKAWGHHLGHLFDTFPTEERKRIAKLFSTQIDSQLGFMGRWMENNNSTELLNKASTGYFKWNGLESFDRGTKTGNMALMAMSIANHSKKAWNKLPEATRKNLERFIDDKEWELLRKKNNINMFTTDNVDALTDQELREHYAQTDKSIPLSELRDDLYRRVYAMFTVNAENTVLAPTDFERAFIFQGTNESQPTGVMLRTFGQFKMFALAFIDRVLIDGLRNADSVQQKIVWATTMMMGTLPLSYAAMFFKNAAMGLTMPDPTKMSVPEREKFLLELFMPSLSLFSGVLDPRSQNAQDMLYSILGSPSISLILNAMSVPAALFLSGDPKSALKKAKKTAGYILPIKTTPIISPIINMAMGDEAHLEPGQQHIFGR